MVRKKLCSVRETRVNNVHAEGSQKCRNTAARVKSRRPDNTRPMHNNIRCSVDLATRHPKQSFRKPSSVGIQADGNNTTLTTISPPANPKLIIYYYFTVPDDRL